MSGRELEPAGSDRPAGPERPRVRRSPVGPLVGLVFVAVLGWAVLFKGDPRKIPSPLVGRAAPGFELAVLTGTFTPGELEGVKALTLERFRGRPVLVNYWASWCIPCRAEAPLLVEAQRKYRDRGFIILGIIFNDTPDAARRFAREYGYNFPLLQDPGGRTAVSYGVTGLPETYFVNRRGVVVSKKIGAVADQAELDRLIEATL